MQLSTADVELEDTDGHIYSPQEEFSAAVGSPKCPKGVRGHSPEGYEITSIRKGGPAVSLGLLVGGMLKAAGAATGTVCRCACLD